jgi:hypothetical protein
MEYPPNHPPTVAKADEAGSAHSRPAWLAIWLLLGVHAALLVASLPDYRVSIDSGYHVSLARWYGEHGTAFWDHINYGPVGRPNLQGPALHMAIALVGRILGGSGDAYVLANAILAVLQWAAAMLTAVFFGRRYGGDRGALFAGALLSGNALAAGSFSVGIPSGWIFILVPWAIYFFLEERLVLATVATSLAIYFHLGGYATVPIGIAVAALFTGRWRSLLLVGAGTAVLTAPYTIHLVRNLSWYRGQRGHVALELAPLIYLAAVPALGWLLRKPREHLFLLAWFAAPIAWIFQDYTRFLAQATLSMSVIGGVGAARMLDGRMAGRWRAVFATTLVALAILPSPLNDPSLAGEAAWVLGLRYPRNIDWGETSQLAGVIQKAGLALRLIAPYNPSQCIRLAVYAPLQFEKGHWVEVQPPRDPAEDLSAGDKVYVLPLAPDDPTLLDLQRRGWVTVHGGSAITSVVTLKPAAPLEAVVPVVAPIISEEASWLSANARNNVSAPWSVLRSTAALAEWRRALAIQRTHAGRLQTAVVLYAYALESTAPPLARGMRGAVRGFGSLANFLGDEACLGFVSESRHQRMRQNLAAVAAAASCLGPDLDIEKSFGEALRRLFSEYFTAA